VFDVLLFFKIININFVILVLNILIVFSNCYISLFLLKIMSSISSFNWLHLILYYSLFVCVLDNDFILSLYLVFISFCVVSSLISSITFWHIIQFFVYLTIWFLRSSDKCFYFSYSLYSSIYISTLSDNLIS
jgi:hypothetical protein